MNNDEYFQTQEFLTLLHEYEEAEKNGVVATLSSGDLTDIAEYYHMQGDLHHAIAVVEMAIDTYPGAIAPLVFRSRAALLKDGNTKQALHYAEQIDDKNDLDYFYIRAEIMIAENHQDDADNYLKNCFEFVEYEEQDDFILDVATLFADYELWEKAQAWADKFEGDACIADYLELEARILSAKGDYEEAEEILNELLDENPFSTHYWNSLAIAQFSNGYHEESLQSCNFALAINPNDADALQTKANALFRLGNFKDALRCYTHYMKVTGIEFPGDTGSEDFLNGLIKELFNDED